MAYITRSVDNLNSISGSDLITEIEYIEFTDDSGNTRKFTIAGLTPVSVKECTQINKDVDWDKNNFHFIMSLDKEIQ